MAVAAEDRTVNLALSRVQQMLAPPSTLLRPAVVRRALVGARHRRAGMPDPERLARSPAAVR